MRAGRTWETLWGSRTPCTCELYTANLLNSIGTGGLFPLWPCQYLASCAFLPSLLHRHVPNGYDHPAPCPWTAQRRLVEASCAGPLLIEVDCRASLCTKVRCAAYANSWRLCSHALSAAARGKLLDKAACIIFFPQASYCSSGLLFGDFVPRVLDRGQLFFGWRASCLMNS